MGEENGAVARCVDIQLVDSFAAILRLQTVDRVAVWRSKEDVNTKQGGREAQI